MNQSKEALDQSVNPELGRGLVTESPAPNHTLASHNRVPSIASPHFEGDSNDDASDSDFSDNDHESEIDSSHSDDSDFIDDSNADAYCNSESDYVDSDEDEEQNYLTAAVQPLQSRKTHDQSKANCSDSYARPDSRRQEQEDQEDYRRPDASQMTFASPEKHQSRAADEKPLPATLHQDRSQPSRHKSDARHQRRGHISQSDINKRKRYEGRSDDEPEKEKGKREDVGKKPPKRQKATPAKQPPCLRDNRNGNDDKQATQKEKEEKKTKPQKRRDKNATLTRREKTLRTICQPGLDISCWGYRDHCEPKQQQLWFCKVQKVPSRGTHAGQVLVQWFERTENGYVLDKKKDWIDTDTICV